ncbi:MAG: SLC13 family permease [Rhodospirillaceae bacterium]|nr:SLC13 family permease [Rhodospirillaceae bacterium]
MPPIAPDLQMWITFALVAGALALYASERLSIELTSLGVIGTFIVFFHLFPAVGPGGRNLMSPEAQLASFANPALIAIVCLLVVGEGVARTGALERAAQWVIAISRGSPRPALAIMLVIVTLASAVLNNTPLVVICIPVMQAVAQRFAIPPSKVMMQLSYAAILGGRLTLIGSSLNVLVAVQFAAVTGRELGFFDVTLPGLAVATAGLAFLIFVMPRLLPTRAGLGERLIEGDSKQFIAQLTVGADSKLVGAEPVGGFFPVLGDLTLRMIQRGERALFAPFEALRLAAGDVLIVAATRRALTDALKDDPGLTSVDTEAVEGETASSKRGKQMLAEVMIPPSSWLVGATLEQIRFRREFRCIVIGIQRRARFVRGPISQLPLEAGDILLVEGPSADVLGLRGNPDVLLIEWSAAELPRARHARRSLAIIAFVVGAAATGILPIAAAAFIGATLTVAAGVLTPREATRAIDRRVALLIAAALPMGMALEHTGGARFLANALVDALDGSGTYTILAAFFLLVAGLTQIISNNACGVLFTPIGVGLAHKIGAPPELFAIAVIFAASCAFATPIGYQTNLLVMGPGHYRFGDFARAGLPMIAIVATVFLLVAPLFFALR